MSDVLNLGDFKSPKTLNTRETAKTAVQNFDLKYREGNFTVSTAFWKAQDLDNKAVKLLINASNVVVWAIVDNDEGDMIKRTPKTGVTKGKTFKGGVMAEALAKNGMLTVETHVKGVEGKNQLLFLNATPTTDGTTVYVVSNVKEGVTETTTEAPAGTTEETTEAPTSNVADTSDLIGGPAIEDENFEEKF